jgi:hypothetical protein
MQTSKQKIAKSIGFSLRHLKDNPSQSAVAFQKPREQRVSMEEIQSQQ